jgi:hypothetical protein
MSMRPKSAHQLCSYAYTHGDPLPAAGIYSDAQIIQLNGPHGSDPIITTSTAAYVGSDILRYPAGTQLADNLTSDGGIYAISGTSTLADPAGDGLTVLTGATVLVNGSQTFSALTIDAGGGHDNSESVQYQIEADDNDDDGIESSPAVSQQVITPTGIPTFTATIGDGIKCRGSRQPIAQALLVRELRLLGRTQRSERWQSRLEQQSARSAVLPGC